MKNVNLSYVMFGIFLLVTITVITCNSNKEEVPAIEVPQEIVTEVTETLETTIEEVEAKVKEFLPALKEVPKLPEVLLPKVEEKTVEPAVKEEIMDDIPADTTLTDTLKQEGEE
jgi:hypothetical protein